MRIKVKLREKGQLLIPKLVRESVGLLPNRMAILEVKEKHVEIRPVVERDIVKEWREIAKKHGGDLKKMKFVYGDELYEEVFG